MTVRPSDFTFCELEVTGVDRAALVASAIDLTAPYFGVEPGRVGVEGFTAEPHIRAQDGSVVQWRAVVRCFITQESP